MDKTAYTEGRKAAKAGLPRKAPYKWDHYRDDREEMRYMAARREEFFKGYDEQIKKTS